MANHPSARKRHRQSRKRREADRSAKARLNTLTRAVREAVAAGDKRAAEERARQASVALAKAASKGLLHPSNASRSTSRLARRVAAMAD